MKKSLFMAGAVSGMASVVLAVPLLAQMAGAQTDTETTERPVPTQACLQAMVGLEDAHLADFDATTASRKQMIQTHRDALAEVAAIADGTARREALQAMHEEMRDSREEHEPSEAVQTAMDAIREECGDMFRVHFGQAMDAEGGRPFIRHIGGKLAEKLGMTEDELQAALESGKTIEEIAGEQGVELPERPAFMMHKGPKHGGFGFRKFR